MKQVTEKVLKSGLVDRHMAEMFEKWGNLPPGASEMVPPDDTLKDATREQLTKLAEEIGDEVDKERTLRETHLDLDRIRWSVEVSVSQPREGRPPSQIAFRVPGVIDRMGRFYFRIQDIDESWFVPGHILHRTVPDKATGLQLQAQEEILEKTTLYVGEQAVCLQVSTHRVA